MADTHHSIHVQSQSGLENILQGFLPGDNIVWQVDRVEDYLPFVSLLSEKTAGSCANLVYFRFAQHPPLLNDASGAQTIRLSTDTGFESFISDIFEEINLADRDTFFVFDCLSDLAADWSSDRMLGNFFMLTCPHIYNSGSIGYFAIIRNKHSLHATDGIFNTSQIIIDVYRDQDCLYVHPVKVFQRHSPTMYMLHQWKEHQFRTVTNSALISNILGSVQQPWVDFSIHRLGVWTQAFTEAEDTQQRISQGHFSPKKAKPHFKKLLRMAISRDDRVLKLANKYLNLSDILDIRKRMIGTGLIGGKAVGMILARAILQKHNPKWEKMLEAHDSFFIGSDVFFTYMVQNNFWRGSRKHRSLQAFLESAETIRKKMLTGSFPKYIVDQFKEILNYFGQTPVIVRSSSALEDNYGNSFSGKYDSVFCANQGTPEQRLEAFTETVRTVYASTMSKEALLYRSHHELLGKDEHMGLLVQRVSGDFYDNLYFPHISGVGYSFNPYVWNRDIDPHDGFLRMVFGLGTRAVDRVDDDYTRVVALSCPQKRPESNSEEVRKYTQKKVDVLDLKTNRHASWYFREVSKKCPHLPLNLFASRDTLAENAVSARPMQPVWILTFDKLLSTEPFTADMQEILQTLHRAYNNSVDIEFTANFLKNGSYKINLVQCRPFHARTGIRQVRSFNNNIPEDSIVFKTTGPVIGNSAFMNIDRIIYVIPEIYSRLPEKQKYSVARAIGRITNSPENKDRNLMLIGPGRWGTSTPSLGVPISFSEISRVSVLCEMVFTHNGLTPDISLGTHFFNDLIELDMIYLSILPDNPDQIIRRDILESHRPPENASGSRTNPDSVLLIIDPGQLCSNGKISLYCNAIKQKAVCYIQQEE